MTYPAFPEFELEKMALEHDEDAKRYRNSPTVAKVYADRAHMLRNAIACYKRDAACVRSGETDLR